MSASAKPPRKRPGPTPPSVDQVARALVDAEVLGRPYAAKRHKVHLNTIRIWERERANDPAVVKLIAQLKARINEGWIETARAARLRLIERQIELAEKADTKLAAVTNALRRTNEVVMAHEVLSDPDGTDDDDQRPGADQPEDQGEDQGPDGAEGDAG